MSEEQHKHPSEEPKKHKDIFSSLRHWKRKGNQDRHYSSQKETQSNDKEGLLGKFFKDYGFQIAAIIINATLAWYTASLYKQAVSQSQSAKTSADAAKEAVSEYRRANDLAQKNFENNNQTAERTIHLTQKSVESQEQAVKDERNRFALENRSFLQISDIKPPTILPDSIFIIDFQITNFGKQPVIIKDFKVALSFNTNRYWDSDSGLMVEPDINNILIPADKSIPNYPQGRINAIQYALIMKNQGYLFLRGQVTYFDPITKKTRLYRYNVSPNLAPFLGVRVIRNEDYPLPAK